MITGINHITLAVADLDRALAFYTEGLGAVLAHRWQGGAYLTLGELWLCLSCDAPNPARDYTHIAFNVAQADFDAACGRLMRAGARPWKENRSEGDSFYFTDPDGHRLELHVGSLATRLAALASRQAAPCTG